MLILEPLCGRDWVEKHKHDLDDWVPKMEIIRPGSKQIYTVRTKKTENEVVRILRGEIK